MDLIFNILISFGIVIILFYILMYGFIKPSREMRKSKSHRLIISEIKEYYNAVDAEISLSNFNSFKSINKPTIIKSIEIAKGDNLLNITFVEYTYVVPNRVKYSPKDDVSIYAVYVLKSSNFNITIFPEELDTKEFLDDFILIRFDRIPINFEKTKREINTILNGLKKYN